MDYVNNLINGIYSKSNKKKIIKPTIKTNKNKLIIKQSKNKLKLEPIYEEKNI